MLGLYDSGIGGLTILQEIQKTFPDLGIHYLADNAHCPLGEKDPAEILQITRDGVNFLMQQGCTIVVLACNTATAIAIRDIQNNWLPAYYPYRKVLGIIRPVSEHLVSQSLVLEAPIVIMATPATINSGFYQEELNAAGFTEIIDLPATGLAGAIESGFKSNVESSLQTVLAKARIDWTAVETVVLACTHYPIIADLILSRLIVKGASPTIRLIGQAKIVADQLAKYIVQHPEYHLESGPVTIWTSSPTKYDSILPSLLNIDITKYRFKLTENAC